MLENCKKVLNFHCKFASVMAGHNFREMGLNLLSRHTSTIIILKKVRVDQCVVSDRRSD